MNKLWDFVTSRTFLTHITGLLGIAATQLSHSSSPAAAIAVAAITGLTQASHAYQAGSGTVISPSAPQGNPLGISAADLGNAFLDQGPK